MIGSMTSIMYAIASSCSMITWRGLTYRWIQTRCDPMDLLVSLKMYAYFNGFVHCTKITGCHICWTILTSRFMESSKTSHWQLGKIILTYIAGTTIFFIMKSTTNYIFLVG